MCWGCIASGRMGGTSPAAPSTILTTQHSHMTVKVAAFAELMCFAAPPVQLPLLTTPAAKPKSIRGFQVSRVEDRGGRFRTAVANADTTTYGLAQCSQEQRARCVMLQEHRAK